MRKGDMRRQMILDTAERLFYEKGYEYTSVQDVLDAMQMSKGGFYHHFESKVSLLEAICEQQNENGFAQCDAAVRACSGNAVEKLNLLLERGFFFGQSSMDFVGLMVRVIYRDGCVQLKEMMRRAALRLYLPMMTRIVHEGVGAQIFFTGHPDEISRIILMLNHCMTDEVASVISDADLGADGAARILDLINAYRDSVELLLNAPHGQIRMLELTRAAEIIAGMAAQERRMRPLMRAAL